MKLKIDWGTAFKAIIYRMVSIAIGGLIVYGLTRKLTVSVAFMIIDTVIKTVWYYLFERFWSWHTAERMWKKRKDIE